MVTLEIMPGEPIPRWKWVQLSQFLQDWLRKEHGYVCDPNPEYERMIVVAESPE